MNRIALLPIVVLFVFCFVLGCSSRGTGEAERISLEAIPQKELVMETLVRIPGDFPPELYLLNDSVLVLAYEMTTAALGIYEVGDTAIGRYSLTKRGEQAQLRIDPAIEGSFELFRNRVLGKYTVAGGVLTLYDFTRFTLGDNRSPDDLVRLDDDLYACIGKYKEGLFGLCKREKKEMRYAGNYPIRPPYMYAGYLNAMSGRMGREADQLVYVSGQFGFIASYRYKYGKLNKLWERQLTDYHYQIERERIVFDPNLHYSGFDGVCLTDKAIYTLYKGQTKAMGLEVPNSILVFDRKGNPLVHCRLPDQMSYIAVDSRNEYLYATYSPYINECYLVRYRLPDLP